MLSLSHVSLVCFFFRCEKKKENARRKPQITNHKFAVRIALNFFLSPSLTSAANEFFNAKVEKKNDATHGEQ